MFAWRLRERAPFRVHPLHLSRACLGKTIVFIAKRGHPHTHKRWFCVTLADTPPPRASSDRPPPAAASAHPTEEKTVVAFENASCLNVCPEPVLVKTIIFPRQALDKHRQSSTQKTVPRRCPRFALSAPPAPCEREKRTDKTQSSFSARLSRAYLGI